MVLCGKTWKGPYINNTSKESTQNHHKRKTKWNKKYILSCAYWYWGGGCWVSLQSELHNKICLQNTNEANTKPLKESESCLRETIKLWQDKLNTEIHRLWKKCKWSCHIMGETTLQVDILCGQVRHPVQGFHLAESLAKGPIDTAHTHPRLLLFYIIRW